MENLYGGGATAGRLAKRGAQQGNGLAFIPPVHPEIGFIYRDNHVAGKELAHTNKTKVGKVRITLGVSLGKILQLFEITRAIELRLNTPFGFAYGGSLVCPAPPARRPHLEW